LIEGRTPNIHVSAKVAQVMGEQAQHTFNNGLDSTYYRELVLQHLRNFKSCKREELEAVLRAKLPDVLSDAQKRDRVKNLLADLSRRNLIAPERKGPGARWRLVTQKKDNSA
jgi:ATP-dependent DNA helicase RecG